MRVSKLLALFAPGILVSLGTAWAFQRGGNDFRVFYTAWSHVLNHEGNLIYAQSPDRFLYAPGFAWIFSWIALMPFSVSLAFWCLAKAAVVGLILRTFVKMGSAEIAGAAMIFIARPLLIDFQYGQFNLFILGACIWALLTHFNLRATQREISLSWFCLAIVAAAKLFPAPLLLIPFIFRSESFRTKRKTEILSAAAGLALVVLVPLISSKPSEALSLLLEWKNALIARGLPTESHNQSFPAFLWHYFSGNPTHVISEGPQSIMIGISLLSPTVITKLTLAWVWGVAGVFFAYLVSLPKRAPLSAIAFLIAFLIVPLHLVWKPYFVLSFPVAYIALEKGRYKAILIGAFILMNFTGFTFVGHEATIYLEAASLMLIAHLALMFVAAVPEHSTS